MSGSRPNLNDYVSFVILVTHPKSYIETTDSCDFGGIPSDWRCGRVLSWKFRNFFGVGGARSKNSIFRILGYPSTILRTAYRKQFYPKTMVTSSARGDTICLRPLLVDNIFVFIRQVAPVQACWQCKTSATSWPLIDPLTR